MVRQGYGFVYVQAHRAEIAFPAADVKRAAYQQGRHEAFHIFRPQDFQHPIRMFSSGERHIAFRCVYRRLIFV